MFSPARAAPALPLPSAATPSSTPNRQAPLPASEAPPGSRAHRPFRNVTFCPPKRMVLPPETIPFAPQNHTYCQRGQARPARKAEATARQKLPRPLPACAAAGGKGMAFRKADPMKRAFPPPSMEHGGTPPRSPPRAPSDGFRFVGKGRGRAFFLSFCGDFGWRFASLFRRVRTQLVDLCQKSSGKGNFPRILFSKRRKRTYLCNCNLGLFRFIQHNCL